MGLFVVLQNEPPRPTQANPATFNNETQTQIQPTAVVETQVVTPVQAEVQPEPIQETVAVTAVAVEPQSYPKGCENYVTLVSQYDWDVTIALNIMREESGCNPNAVGDNRVIGGLYAPSCGLMQIRTLVGRPTCDELHTPSTNIAWAYKLYKGGGWHHWSVCRSSVKCY